MDTLKTCFICHKEKRLEEFYRHPRMADGHLGKCKDCTKAYIKLREETLKRTDLDWHEKELERHRKKAAKARAEGRQVNEAAYREAQKKWRELNKHKRAAHASVQYALKAGTLLRKPCEKCGEKAQAHHDDYTKPLEVRWLCVRHHNDHHNEERRQKRLLKFKITTP